MQVSKIPAKIFQFVEILLNKRLFRLIEVTVGSQAEHFGNHFILLLLSLWIFRGLAIILLFDLVPHLLHILWDALLAKWNLAHVYNRFWEVLLADVLV